MRLLPLMFLGPLTFGCAGPGGGAPNGDLAIGDECVLPMSWSGSGPPCPEGSECQEPEGGAAVCGAPACGDGFLGPSPAECEDGNDVSGDGCSAACAIEDQGPAGSNCESPARLNLPRVRGVFGDYSHYAAGMGDFVAGSDLGAGCSAAAGPEAVYVIEITRPSFVELRTFGTDVISLRLAGAVDCGADELGCATGDSNAALELSFYDLEPGRYAIVLDRADPSAAATPGYTIQVAVRPLD